MTIIACGDRRFFSRSFYGDLYIKPVIASSLLGFEFDVCFIYNSVFTKAGLYIIIFFTIRILRLSTIRDI